MRKLAKWVVLFAFLVGTYVAAGNINIPYIFTSGTIIDPSQMNANFSAITAVVNGSIDNSNISASANIALSKLAQTAQLFIRMATGNNTISSGITGDAQPRITFDSDGKLKFGAGGASATDCTITRTGAAALTSDSKITHLNSTSTLATAFATNATLLPLTITNFGTNTGAPITRPFGVLEITDNSTAGTGPNCIALYSLTTDTIPSMTIGAVTAGNLAGGTFTFGPGGSSNRDTFLGRSAAGSMWLGSTSTAAGTLAGAINPYGAGGSTPVGNNKWLQTNSVGIIAAATSSPVIIGGDGSAGAVSIVGNTTDTQIQQRNATSFNIATGITLTVVSGSQANCTGAFTTTGTGIYTGTGNGYKGGTGAICATAAAGCTAQRGQGPTPGEGQVNVATQAVEAGGGGGANGTNGGNGGSNLANYVAQGGKTGALSLVAGSGGGAGLGDGTNAGGSGGQGGALISIISGTTITNNGTISSSGSNASNGAAGSAAGGGGGSGGTIYLAAITGITNNGSIIASGGNGGNSASGATGGGGGGGTGPVFLHTAGTIAAGSVTQTGGSAGTGSATQAATAGTAGSGAISITTTPNIPLIGEIMEHGMMLQYLADFNGAIGRPKAKDGTWHFGFESTQMMAALADPTDFDRICIELSTGEYTSAPLCIDWQEDLGGAV